MEGSSLRGGRRAPHHQSARGIHQHQSHLRSAHCPHQILYRVAIVAGNQMCHQHCPATFSPPRQSYISANFRALRFQRLSKTELISRYANWELAMAKLSRACAPTLRSAFDLPCKDWPSKVVVAELIITSNLTIKSLHS